MDTKTTSNEINKQQEKELTKIVNASFIKHHIYEDAINEVLKAIPYQITPNIIEIILNKASDSDKKREYLEYIFKKCSFSSVEKESILSEMSDENKLYFELSDDE